MEIRIRKLKPLSHENFEIAVTVVLLEIKRRFFLTFGSKMAEASVRKLMSSVFSNLHCASLASMDLYCDEFHPKTVYFCLTRTDFGLTRRKVLPAMQTQHKTGNIDDMYFQTPGAFVCGEHVPSC